MTNKFRLGRSVFFILTFVLLFGLFLEVIRSNYALTLGYNQFQDNVVPGAEERADSKSTIKKTKPEYLLIYDEESQLSQSVYTNIEQTLTYMKKEYESDSVQSLTNSYDSFQTVIVSFEALNKLGDIRKLEDYVAHGGTVLFAVRPAIDDAFIYLYRKLGIYEFGGFVTTTGITLTSNLLANQEGLNITGNFIRNSSLFVGIENQNDIYAQSEDDIPLLWESQYKEGKFILFNGTMFNSKSSRGLLGAAISLVQNDFIQPIMNVKMSYIDGFPTQFPSGESLSLYQTYKKDIAGFYRDIWWPDIQQTAFNYELRYTSGFVQVNDNNVLPPFNKGLQQQDFIKYVRELMKVNGELALKGYNNVPLLVGETYWESNDDLYVALEQVQQFVYQSFPNYQFKSYYPASLETSEVGLQAIQQTVPSVENVVVDYTEQSSEFKQVNRLTQLPVISTGYAYSEQTKWSIINAIYSLGVYSHQISPWEVLTSSTSWNNLASTYNEMNRDVEQKYPWLRAMTSSEAGPIVKRYLETDVGVTQTDTSISVELSQFVDDFYFLLRTDKIVKAKTNCIVEEIDQGVYLVTAKKATFEIGLDGS